MKRTFLFLLATCCCANLVAQEFRSRPSYELFGSASFENSSFSQPNINTLAVSEDLQTISVKPGIGYFLTQRIELLGALNYDFSAHATTTQFGTGELRRHRVGVSGGAIYNLTVGSEFVPFVGAKIGVSWAKSQPSSVFDTGWGKPEISFPMIVLGGRYFVADRWAFLLLFEYAVTRPYGNPTIWKTVSSTTTGLGLSVFLD